MSGVASRVLDMRRVLPGRDGFDAQQRRSCSARLAVAIAVLASAIAPAAMRSERLPGGLCETTGGARIVDVPGFPGERIDRRLLYDIRLLQRRYKIFVTDGYSTDDVHASNGEHPLGLALDIVPDTAAGGTWRDITALARWAEPRQNQPIAPFRWVGYDGDAGHGRGHHLHLSWNHSETKPGVSPATVYTMSARPSASCGGGSGGGGGGKRRRQRPRAAPAASARARAGRRAASAPGARSPPATPSSPRPAASTVG